MNELAELVTMNDLFMMNARMHNSSKFAHVRVSGDNILNIEYSNNV